MSAQSDAGEVVPFMAAVIAADARTRPFAAALPVSATRAARSPWTVDEASPTPAALTAQSTSTALELAAELAKLRADAVAAGRAEGLREVERSRAKLAALADALVRTQSARDAHAAEVISGAAIAVIEAWLGRAITGAERFAPIVSGWLAAGGGDGAIARVNPADVAAMREAVGEAPIEVAADAAITAGDVRITVGARELHHVWSERLGELREAIAASVMDAGATRAESES